MELLTLAGVQAVRCFRKRLAAKGKGQAITEMVLLFPLFMFFMLGMLKIFAILILVQKIEIAAFYAAKRWQLESHRNAKYAEGGDSPWDDNQLLPDIVKKVRTQLGCDNTKTRNLLELDCRGVRITVRRTQVWNVVRLQVPMTPIKMPMFRYQFRPFVVTKYVPNRDRPIGFNLPGI